MRPLFSFTPAKSPTLGIVDAGATTEQLIFNHYRAMSFVVS